MLNHATYDKLLSLKLNGMAEAFQEMQENATGDELTHAEWLGLLSDREDAHRRNKRFQTLMRSARLRHARACPEDVDYRSDRGLDKGQFKALLTLEWIRKGHNVIITGPCGVGKTWLACALGMAACRTGNSAIYRRMPRLLSDLEVGHGDGSFPKLFRAISRTRLLILDDWGPTQLTASQRTDLMEIVEERSESGSILITSQLPVSSWHEVIGDPTIADAILDRLVNNAYRIELSGESLRKPISENNPEKKEKTA